jgi:hypothetical protein
MLRVMLWFGAKAPLTFNLANQGAKLFEKLTNLNGLKEICTLAS